MTTAQDNQTYWKRCSSCKSEMAFSKPYWVCSVSTCTRKRTGMVFCSVACWEMHLPMMRHREAYAVEMRSPTRDQWLREQAEEDRDDGDLRAAPGAAPRATQTSPGSASAASAGAPADSAVVRRRVAVPAPSAQAQAQSQDGATSGDPDDALDDIDDELRSDILIVASKLKKYIRARSGMNTSDGVMSRLSDHVRAICDQAIRNAAQDGRKTVLDRDIPRPGRSGS